MMNKNMTAKYRALIKTVVILLVAIAWLSILITNTELFFRILFSLCTLLTLLLFLRWVWRTIILLYETILDLEENKDE